MHSKAVEDVRRQAYEKMEREDKWRTKNDCPERGGKKKAMKYGYCKRRTSSCEKIGFKEN